ncbi:MAG: hypothetical protein O7C75_19340 [Verrucomicrobia bacterium]|nr:hypothetical protein [Verrucomicrobiota bacterium]
MDTKKLLIGTVAGTVTSFIAGFLVFGLALKSYMATNSTFQDSPDFVWIVIGHIIFSLLITYIFLQWAGIKTVVEGLKAGALIGLLVALSYNSFFLATSDVFTGGITTAIVAAIGDTIIWATCGAGVGWALGRGD